MRSSFFTHIKDTPKALRILLWLVIGISFFSAALNKFFTQVLEVLGTQQIFSLSLDGGVFSFLWQPLTYLFVHSADDGISFSFLLHLFFNVYLIWVIGSTLIQRKGFAAFLRLYLCSGIIAGLVGLWIIHLTQSPALIAGASSAIYASMVAWSMLYPDLHIRLFHSFHVKVKWLLIGFLGLSLLSDLSDGFFINFAVYTFGALTGYIYTVIAWGLPGPFTFTHPFDLFLVRTTRNLASKAMQFFYPKAKPKHGQKIYDIKTGEIIVEDATEDRHSGMHY